MNRRGFFAAIGGLAAAIVCGRALAGTGSLPAGEQYQADWRLVSEPYLFSESKEYVIPARGAYFLASDDGRWLRIVR